MAEAAGMACAAKELGVEIYSFRTESYKKCLDKLDPRERQQADESFRKWVSEGAQERRLNVDSSVLSVKLSEGNRAVGVEIESPKAGARGVVWFFVGKHSDYEHMIQARRLGPQLAKIADKMPEYRRRISEGIGKAKAPAPKA